MNILFYLLFILLFTTRVTSDDQQQEQTYLRVSQPDINGHFILEDAIPTSDILWTFIHNHNNEVTIEVCDIVEILLRQVIVGHLEEIEVYFNKRLRYVCHYIDRRRRDKLMVIVISNSSYGIAETPFSRCLRIS